MSADSHSTSNGKVHDSIQLSQDQRSDQKQNGSCNVVYGYLISPQNGNGERRFKLGYATNFLSRDKQHRAEAKRNVNDLTHLFLVRASKADEGKLHRLFKHLSWNNQEEIYHVVPEIAEWIRWLRDQHYVYVPDDEKCQPIEDLEIVDADFWMPNLDRKKVIVSDGTLFPSEDVAEFPRREVTVDDFYTGSVILEAARKAFGGVIDLDPASHAIANSEVKATRFFTKADDGLLREWGGSVWLNPPFSQWAKWVPKIIGEWGSGRISSMCILCATRTMSAQYFEPVRESCSAVCITNGRIPFWGERASSPDDGHAIFFFGRDVELFKQAFSTLGTIFYGKAETV